MKYVTGVSQMTVDFHGAKHTFFKGEVLPEQILPYLGEEQEAALSDSPTGEAKVADIGGTPRKKRKPSRGTKRKR